MTGHEREHGQRILGLAIGAEEEIDRRDEIRTQLASCDDCLSYGYRVMADVSLVRAALVARGDTARPAAAPEGLRLLERTLEDAMADIAARDAAEAEEELRRTGSSPSFAESDSPVGASPARPSCDSGAAHAEGAVVIPFPRRATFWGAVGVTAAAAAAVALILLSFPADVSSPVAPPRRSIQLAAERPVPATFARTQFAAVRSLFADGLGFASVGGAPTPFARGYGLGLLRDLRSGTTPSPLANRLASDLAEIASLDGRTSSEDSLRADGCEALVAEEGDSYACEMGIAAYRIVRDLELEKD